jgi:hypothetical protein
MLIRTERRPKSGNSSDKKDLHETLALGHDYLDHLIFYSRATSKSKIDGGKQSLTKQKLIL